ncbi:MAG TPA: hypothetical protein VJX67_17310 [Blastocatellia bacterium]|nr:hypothetical protein [Blastocatellia bacterium]
MPSNEPKVQSRNVPSITRRLTVLRFLPYLAISLFAALSCVALNSHFNVIDDSYYVVVAKALATGQGYSNIYLPHPTPHTHFPPGLPVLLSLPMLLGWALGPTIIVCKLILTACAVLALLAFARLAQLDGYTQATTALAVVLSALSVVLVSYTCRVASEMLYMLLSVLSLLAVQRYRRAAYQSWWGPAAGVLISAAVLTRSIGVVLLVAITLELLRTCEFKRLAAVLAPASLILATWVWRTRGSTGGSGYAKDFAVYGAARHGSWLVLLTEPAKNLWFMAHAAIPRMIVSILQSEAVQSNRLLGAAALPVELGVSLVVLYGIVLGFRKESSPTHLYLVAYLALIAVYPWDPTRYLIPILPFLCISFIAGLRDVFRQVGKWTRSELIHSASPVAAVIAVCVASSILSDGRFVLAARTTGDFSSEAAISWHNTMDAYRWIESNTVPSSVIGCVPTIEANVYLYTGRKAISLPAHTGRWASAGMTYVLSREDKSANGESERRVENRLFKVVQASAGGGDIAIVYRNPDVAIYKVERSNPDDPQSSTVRQQQPRQ